MNYKNQKKRTIVLCLCVAFSFTQPQKDLVSPDQWAYIQIDSTRAKWGDWDKPEWLRYFGLDMEDVTGDGFKDIVAGRYFYRNPGRDMSSGWERVDLGMNVDGMLFVETGDNGYDGIIATALPKVYWFKANDPLGKSWKATLIAELPATSHVNGQGYARTQIIPGGNEEILLATGEGIYYCQVPSDPVHDSWSFVQAAPEASDEGFGVGDIDGDGFADIAAGKRGSENEGGGMEIRWWKNPGNGEAKWESFPVGFTRFDADRIAVADISGDGRADIVVTEERYPGKEPDASLYWFEQSGHNMRKWERRHVVTQYSMNNLDVADMNGDGFPDLITAEHKGPKPQLQIWSNDGKGNFIKKVIDTGKESHLGARAADLNNDGKTDIVSIGWDRYRYLHLWQNDGKTNNTK